MSIEKLSNDLFELAKEKGVNELEVYSQTVNSLGIRYFDGKIDNYSIENASGVSCRGTFKGNMGSSYTENMNDNADSLIDGLISNAEIINSDDEKFLFEGSNEYRHVSTYEESLDEIENQRKIEFLKKLEAYALKLDNRIEKVNTCYYGEEFGESLILNSKGLDLKSKSNLALAYISVIAKEDDDVQTGFDYIASRDFEDFDPEYLAQKAVTKAINKLGAKSISSGHYKVILKNEAAADLLESYISIFSAEAVQKGLSLLKDRLGKVVTDKGITIVDDPFLEDGFSSKGFDSEGVATKFKEVILDGELKTYLYDLKTAKIDGVEPTGNGSRASYKSTINISPSNMYMLPGEAKFDQMVMDMHEGIVITDLQGLHAGVNTVSGDFSLSAEGFLVENGIMGRPINQITIAGNFLEVLCDVGIIGNDLIFNLPSSMGTIGCPSLLINKVSVSGE